MTIIEREPVDPAKKLLWDTADFLEVRGWTQGTYSYEEANEYCLVGALNMTFGVEPYSKSKNKVLLRARKILANAIGIESKNLTTWNDRAKRQKEEVIEALRKAARN